MSYGYRRTITIDRTKVGGSSSSNFPVLVSGTYSYLATVAFSGKVTNSSGYDIIFTSDAAGQTLLSWEIETYTAASGLINFWIKVPTLSSAVDTVIYMFYGNAAISTFQGGALGAAWDSSFVGVYHVPNGVSLTSLDSTSLGNNLTTNTAVTAVAGKINGGASFNGTTSVLSRAAAGVTNNVLTFSGWFNIATTADGPYPILTLQTAGSNNHMQRLILYQNKVTIQSQGGAGVSSLIQTGTFSANVWNYAVAVVNGASSRLAYLNITPSSTDTTTITPVGVNKTLVGKTESGDEFYVNSLDELRISNVVRPLPWLTAEYNNQNDPSSFYSVSGESVTPAPQNNGLNNVSNLSSLNLNRLT